MNNRVDYLDNLKVLLTILVVAVHAAITYGSEGGWYWAEPTNDLLAIVPLTLLSAVSQSFFMSLFFFLAAYFTPASYDRKGVARFVKDRLIRLGIPCVLFGFGIGPLTLLFTLRVLEGIPFHYSESIHLGPLWFAEALLFLTGAYVVFRLIRDRVVASGTASGDARRPKARSFWIAGVVMAVLTFGARWVYPVGEGYWGMQFGSFPQYIMMFVAGLMAYRRRWLDGVSSIPTWKLGVAAAVLTVTFPVAMFLGADTETGFVYFLGGPYWQAGVYAVWESAMCIVMSLLLVGIFGRRSARRSSLDDSLVTTGSVAAPTRALRADSLSASAFTAYILHPLVLVSIAAAMVGLNAHPLVKFVILLATGTAVTFLIAEHFRKLPLLRRVL